ncbi:hypothetical protein FOZ60_000306 [Perkinsus olseni]|uniref:Uncharacterized protein n=1 Tax=Perkinsus olseni TaxID=32597 RepID=A0A7J6P2L3_PEROL|nr:hypothetical protein FOZ60_000306 [Perkinsus olseni]
MAPLQIAAAGMAPGRRIKRLDRTARGHCGGYVARDELPAGTYGGIKKDGVHLSLDLPNITGFKLVVEDGTEGQEGYAAAEVQGEWIYTERNASLVWYSDHILKELRRFGSSIVLKRAPTCFHLHPRYTTTDFIKNFHTHLQLEMTSGKGYAQLIFCLQDLSVIVGIGGRKRVIDGHWLSCDYGLELFKPADGGIRPLGPQTTVSKPKRYRLSDPGSALAELPDKGEESPWGTLDVDSWLRAADTEWVDDLLDSLGGTNDEAAEPSRDSAGEGYSPSTRGGGLDMLPDVSEKDPWDTPNVDSSSEVLDTESGDRWLDSLWNTDNNVVHPMPDSPGVGYVPSSREASFVNLGAVTVQNRHMAGGQESATPSPAKIPDGLYEATDPGVGRLIKVTVKATSTPQSGTRSVELSFQSEGYRVDLSKDGMVGRDGCLELDCSDGTHDLEILILKDLLGYDKLSPELFRICPRAGGGWSLVIQARYLGKTASSTIEVGLVRVDWNGQ